MFKSEKLETILVEREADAAVENLDNCPLGFLLFLEPSKKCSKETMLENIVDTAVRTFQPYPVMEHVEIALPPMPTHDSTCTNFATYFGEKSGWRSDRDENAFFYMRRHGGQWRAMPIYAKNATERIRNECHLEQDVSYSIGKYVTSAYPLRSLAWMLPTGRKSPAHCATLTARILQNALPNTTICTQSSNYYGPSTLYKAACEHARSIALHLGVETKPLDSLTAMSMEKLINGPATPEAVAEIGDEGALHVVTHLAHKVFNLELAGDEVSRVLAQKQLATALIRWTIFRTDDDASEEI